jgi:DNA-directed RNA polymerase specialized sigma24 family protein
MLRHLPDLSVDELARRCRQETQKYMGGHPHDDAYGLELFRRAIIHHDQTAWKAIYAEYQALVTLWVQRHSRFESINEEATFFVNAAFARFWHTASRHTARLQFNDLGGLLRYLRLCVYSVIEDECRRRRRWPQDAPALDDLLEVMADGVPSPEARAISQMAAEALEQSVLSHLRGEEEEVIATLSWTYGLHPRQIQANRPDLFADVRRVYQVKRNILNRLLRDPEIRQLMSQLR